MADRRRVRACRNPQCDELLAPYVRWPLCPSCRWVCRVTALTLGAYDALVGLALYAHAHGWLF